MKSTLELPIDVNARMTDRGYLLVNGTIAALAQLGLSPAQAVGMTFIFNSGTDTDENGRPAEIVFNGTIEADAKFGFLVVSDFRGLQWRLI